VGRHDQGHRMKSKSPDAHASGGTCPVHSFSRGQEGRSQLLRGTGTNELIGLFNRTGGQAINLYTRLAADDNTTALAKVIANTRGSSFLQPDGVIMHPTSG
jgi:hypothetical protein